MKHIQKDANLPDEKDGLKSILELNFLWFLAELHLQCSFPKILFEQWR